MLKRKGILFAAVIFVVSVFIYAITVYMPKVNEEQDYLNEIATAIKNGEYIKAIDYPEKVLSTENQKEKNNLVFYAKALDAKEKGNISDYKYFLYRIPKEYKGRLNHEIKKSREDVKNIIQEEKDKERKAHEDKIRQEKQLEEQQTIAEIERILNNMPSKTDDVEKITWYQPWGSNGYPAKDAIYWYVGERNGEYWLRAFIVHFDDGINWVFWDKVIFSTSNTNWIYNIENCFAGQSGGGKDTQIVHGGKYETLDVRFSDLERGYKLLATDKNPIIRLQGRDRHHDYYLTSADINLLNTGIYLNEQLKKLNYRISK